ncbi:hypothetical protein NCLIV_057370 [Neospora caninum Liverpool]|uniref:Uncharacterized protein n=1 Tax=Neospora caninum (strain Liverpool) TaxID=572307 RepID=F0VNL8_NEOCL|nr:hypothetical protein NCLIV_057370 [Neospora caninum Liverpool]CBZ55314.1 hypothetical protein NCLIV_057370 [Neospora caninum Liverpool]|eukprot:XP_003885342.1 hypothetical protein NCLIV_057370 [Neospora caninum Liverpool]
MLFIKRKSFQCASVDGQPSFNSVLLHDAWHVSLSLDVFFANKSLPRSAVDVDCGGTPCAQDPALTSCAADDHLCEAHLPAVLLRRLLFSLSVFPTSRKRRGRRKGRRRGRRGERGRRVALGHFVESDRILGLEEAHHFLAHRWPLHADEIGFVVF